MRNKGVGSWPARRARKTPGRVAVVHDGREWTYQSVHQRVQRLAWALRDLGVGRGDRIAYLGPNHPAFLETLFAAGVLGAVFVPLNTRLAAPEIAFNLADSGTAVLIHAPEQADVATTAAADAAVIHRIALAGPGDGALGYSEFLASGRDEPIDTPVGLDDVCMIMYTSGTTGRPKGAVLSHGNITWNCFNVLVDVDFAGDEVTLVVAPLFHTAGLNLTCLPTLLKGGRVVLVGAFDPARVLETIESQRVTYMFGVPTMYGAMVASPRWAKADLSSLRSISCGGAPVPMHTIRTYLARGLAFSQGYGMTEASPGVLYLDRAMASVKVGSAGVPHFFTDVRIVTPDDADAEPGDRGELLVSGPNVMSGYWGQPDATAAAFADGEWFRSGDIAEVDDDGYYSIVDRVKDMILSGGENIYPAEVEAVLREHPAVADCALIGIPDPRWGEVGRAVVVLRSGADTDEQDVTGFLAGRLAKYKIPRSVVFVDALPRNATGKILKPTLRARFGERPTVTAPEDQ